MNDSTVVNPLTGNMQGECTICGTLAPVYVNGKWLCYDHSAYAEVDKLRKALKPLVEALRAVEWVEDIEGWTLCPSCGAHDWQKQPTDGHGAECQLAAALADAEKG